MKIVSYIKTKQKSSLPWFKGGPTLKPCFCPGCAGIWPPEQLEVSMWVVSNSREMTNIFSH